MPRRTINIQLRRDRSIELDTTAKIKLAGVWSEIELVLLRIQREMAVGEMDSVMAGSYVQCIAKIKDEFQSIAIEGEKIKEESKS